ncbi:AMP-binding protein [Nocardioides insulae]|uniref:AMP-binding protein n=1 Tax=Nocardioides insulae TaxID=394734 RepID=UPI00041BDB52|nr:AMP-binding protein [Nocardioides insulae]
MDYRGARDVVRQVSAWLAATDPEPWVVETSGSTGRPKRVVLSRQAMLASADASAARVGGAGRWLLAVPASFVAGLNVVVRSLYAGHEPVLLEEHPSFAAAAEATLAGGGDCFVSLVPTQLHRLLDDRADAAALARFHTLLLGGGPIDPALRARAEAAGVTVVATYGSAETCGGCVYDGVPLDGVRVGLADDGRIRLAGTTLFERYDGDPDLTASSLVDGWFLTSDAGRLTEAGALQVLGRLDDVVVTGGLNVPAPAVAARLRAHPAVDQAEVLGIPDDEWGHRLVAFVVAVDAPAEGAGTGAPTLAELREWVGAERPRAWAPRQVVHLAQLPLLGNGKPDRLRLRALAEEHADEPVGERSPQRTRAEGARG